MSLRASHRGRWARLLSFGLLLAAGSAVAQTPTPPAAQNEAAKAGAGGGAGSKTKARPKRAPRVIQIEALKVSGQVQKPEAFYILQRSELDFKGLEPKKSFVPLILKSVEKEPF